MKNRFFSVSCSVLLLTACGANQAAKSNANVNIADKANTPESSYISKCMDHTRLLATFSKEGNWVKEYAYGPQSDGCRGVPTINRLQTLASVSRNTSGDEAEVALSNYKINSFSGTDLSNYVGETSEFFEKWEGICSESSDLAKTGNCSEQYFFDYYSSISGFPVITYSVNMYDGRVYGESWVTSNMYREDWKKDCTHFEEITVKAGHFKTCVVDSPEATVWVGKTPFFQVIKVEVKPGKQLVHYHGRAGSFHGVESIRSFELSEIAY